MRFVDSTSCDSNHDLAHLAIMASAGSGKTFQLTNRYLRLLMDGAEPSSILASTFTRLAAGEIRDRVLHRIGDAAMDDDACRELGRHIGHPSLSRAAALELLERLTQRLHQLQVRTLDSFFAAIVRCFALEIGIDPAARIANEDEAMRLRQNAIRLMLDERDPQPLIDLLRVLTDGAADRSVTAAIDGLVGNLHELYREAPAAAWTALEPVPGLLDRDDLHRALNRLGEHVPAINHKGALNSHAESAAKLRGSHVLVDHWRAWLKMGIASKLIAGETTFYKKSIPDETIAVYQPLLEHARAVIRQSIIRRTEALRDLLERFDRQYALVKKRDGVITFADLAHAINHPRRPTARETIWFRLDATLQHLLLDEMQDTSIAQWQAIAPIAAEITSVRPPDRTFFCVGDVKQSIYGWREACPEILESMPALLAGVDGTSPVQMQTLSASWRSSPIVIEFVNRVFRTVERNTALREAPAAAQEWAAIFPEHKTMKTHAPGYVELRVASRNEHEAARETKWDDAAELIASLHRRAPHQRIGVLTRTNTAVNELLYRLGPTGADIPATGRGGGALTDAAAVNAALDLLRLADHPEHTTAAFNVMHSPLGPAVGLTPPGGDHSVGGPVSIGACRAVARRVRRDLLQRGYAVCIGRWMRDLAADLDPRQMRRLVQLQQLAIEHDQRPTLRADDFVRFVERTTVADPYFAPVVVMTIHQSKGLEFDLVVLPDLDKSLVTLQNLQVISERSAPGSPTVRIARYPGVEECGFFDDTRRMLDGQRARQARESLALLYVAMTRARSALHMFIDAPRPNEQTLPTTFAGFLREALELDRPEPGTVPFTNGDPEWWRSRPADSDETTPPPPAWVDGDEPPRLRPTRETGRYIARGRSSRAASSLPDEQTPLRDLLQVPHDEARDRGTAVHAMFERINWLDSFDVDDDVLRGIARSTAPRRGETWAEQMAAAFREMLQHPTVRAALSRDARATDGLELHREWPFARLVDDAVQQGSIDRLILERDATGRVVWARILDFKTDQIDAAAADARAARYRPQLAVYRSAVAEAFALEPSAIDADLLFVQCGTLVRV